MTLRMLRDLKIAFLLGHPLQSRKMEAGYVSQSIGYKLSSTCVGRQTVKDSASYDHAVVVPNSATRSGFVN